MLERRKLKLKKLGLGNNNAGDALENEKTEAEQLEHDSQTSYFTLSQYNTLNKRINEAHFRMKEQQQLIDSLDKNVADAINKIRERKRRAGNSSHLTSSRQHEGLLPGQITK